MYRLLFEKVDNAVWISHLDLMRLFQRAFKRAGLSLTHTQGFNPRPSVSIALPLSVGTESVCELLDFALEEPCVPVEEIPKRLNACLVPGVRVLDAFCDGRKLKDLSYMRAQIILTYDDGINQEGVTAIRELFLREALSVPKKTKSGLQDQDIIPMIREITVSDRKSVV